MTRVPAATSPELTFRSQAVADHLESWFLTIQRDLPWRNNYDPYQVWVSEIMLQQTRMEVVLRYFPRFIERFPNLVALGSATEENVLAAWAGLGYYRRARMLREGALTVMETWNGVIPEDVADLRRIPGIGRYTAGAIASIAFDRREPIVDGNVARVLARLYALDQPLGSVTLDRQEWEIATELVVNASSPRNMNQSLMELGSLVCRPRNPLCEECPISPFCEANLRGAVENYPVVVARPPGTQLTVPLYIVRDNSGRILMRRETGRLMKGLVHLPHGGGGLFDGPESFEPQATRLLGSFRHTITHRRITFVVHEADLSPQVRESREEFVWVDPLELSSHAHPSYVAKAICLVNPE